MFKSIIRANVLAISLAAIVAGPALAADEREAELRSLVHERILPIVRESIVVDSVKVQNQANLTLNAQAIRRLDKIWRDEVKRAGGALINEVLANPLSRFLKRVEEDNDGLFNKIYVMDAKGLNVGQSEMTPDYWQGDEGKWQKTFLAGRGAIRISKVKFDDKTNKRKARITVTIVDPKTDRVIGAMSFGINVDELG
jgi:hypothetical protein